MRLVAEMSAGFEQLLHGDDRSRHNHFLSGSVRWEAVIDELKARATPVYALPMWD